MSSHKTDKPSLDGVLESIRHEQLSRAELDAAAERTRHLLGIAAGPGGTAVHIESCAGFQALIPAYLAGELPRETALLLEDHTRECIPCRRALIAARTPRAVPDATPAARRRPAYVRWSAAAAVAAVAVLGAYTTWQALPLLGADPTLKVIRIDGTAYRSTSGSLTPLGVGMIVSAKDSIRTAKDSGAILAMDDGSRIEMRDRTEIAVAKRRDGSTIKLGGGAIIVEASPQGSGHLDVRTDDCLVAVKGTIFAVNSGTRGSRVSVVEGAVQVAADGHESLLKPGEQMTTSDAVTPVAVGDEIAWSTDAARYNQLLHELTSLRKDLDARVPNPKVRYGSRLLDTMPAGTVVYAAIPNLTEALVQAKAVFEEHVAQSGELQNWWNQHMSSPESRREMDEAFERIRTYGSHLGDEIVISVSMDATGRAHGPIVSAEVDDPGAFRRMLAKDLRKSADGKQLAEDVSMSFDDHLVRIQPVNKAKVVPVTTTWATSPLRARIDAAYTDGAAWLFAADLKTMLAEAAKKAENGEHVEEGLERTGLIDAEYLVFERTEGPEGADHRAELSFDQPRRGLAGWLASPAPMGAADFVSPDASFAAAAVMKRPEALVAEALTWVGPQQARLELDEDSEAGLQILKSLSSTLGGDVAVALDGPLLPIPSWKVVIEVYQPAQFQAEFEKLIAHANDRIAADGHEGRLVVEREEIGNRTDWVVRYTGSAPDGTPMTEGNPMRYTFNDGYLIAAPSRVLIDRAIEQRGDHYTLTRSQEFLSLLPADGDVNVSAFVWEHLGPSIEPIAQQLRKVMTGDDAGLLDVMTSDHRPHLITARAEDDRIVVGSRGDAGLGSILGSIVSARRLESVGEMLNHAHRESAQGDAKPQ